MSFLLCPGTSLTKKKDFLCHGHLIVGIVLSRRDKFGAEFEMSVFEMAQAVVALNSHDQVVRLVDEAPGAQVIKLFNPCQRPFFLVKDALTNRRHYTQHTDVQLNDTQPNNKKISRSA